VKLTGRIEGVPSEVWHQEVLGPQFAYEVQHLLPWYLTIEKALLAEYVRMGLCDPEHAAALAARLDALRPEEIAANPVENMSDIAFALERHVATGPVPPFPAWHVDRSRNDLQATAQRMAGRELVLGAIEAVADFGRAAADVAEAYADTPMPGQTHLQAAQVITPGFWFAAVVEETLRTLRRLRSAYAEVDRCPLGAGAMAGQELAWDRDRMAALLGFAEQEPHALVAVASRGWALAVGADLSAFGVVLSRFATDLMAWGSAGYGYLDLPDELSGISSAMPQKKNFPILERIRGRSAHLVSHALDLSAAQRNTPYTNMVEVSKEAAVALPALFDTLRSTLRLATLVLGNLRLDAARMRADCDRDHLGGFTLANLLTLSGAVPWRTAQVVAGRYVVAAVERGLPPGRPDGALLAGLLAEEGSTVDDPGALLVEAFDTDGALAVKRSAGSTAPEQVRRMLARSTAALDAEAAWVEERQATIGAALSGLDTELRGRR
jgi:argininosuccinate lyase